MIADWILVGDDFGYLAETVAAFVGWGLGFGAVLWVVGFVVYWLTQFLRY